MTIISKIINLISNVYSCKKYNNNKKNLVVCFFFSNFAHYFK